MQQRLDVRRYSDQLTSEWVISRGTRQTLQFSGVDCRSDWLACCNKLPLEGRDAALPTGAGQSLLLRPPPAYLSRSPLQQWRHRHTNTSACSTPTPRVRVTVERLPLSEKVGRQKSDMTWKIAHHLSHNNVTTFIHSFIKTLDKSWQTATEYT